jgi:ribosomal protein S18 acetylase RimI-like enzyme
MAVEIICLDYLDLGQANDMVYLLNAYACDPMGGGKALSVEVQENIAREMAKLPHAFSVIAYVEGKPAGLVNCFEAFSTFMCKPLINIHDVIVLEAFRGIGLSHKMLEKVEEIAREKQCCKITLEVLSKNEIAKASYAKYGFKGYELDPKAGYALFWQKELTYASSS